MPPLPYLPWIIDGDGKGAGGWKTCLLLSRTGIKQPSPLLKFPPVWHQPSILLCQRSVPKEIGELLNFPRSSTRFLLEILQYSAPQSLQDVFTALGRHINRRAGGGPLFEGVLDLLSGRRLGDSVCRGAAGAGATGGQGGGVGRRDGREEGGVGGAIERREEREGPARRRGGEVGGAGGGGES